jgi:DNA-binding NarL/FixJ family response regulator
LLKETDDLEWVGCAADGIEAIEKIRSLQPDVAILDIEMPHYTGLEVAQMLIGEGIKTRFILLTLFKEESFFRNAMRTGVRGYLLKESSEKEILDCIRSVNEGKPYVNPSLTHYLISEEPDDNILVNLTNHEVNILKLIARQKTTVEIANMLFISPKTVSNHRGNIGKKLNLSGEQNGLLKWAIENRDLLR